MALNKLEKELVKLVYNSRKIDIMKVEKLFKLGANPNALECNEPEHSWDDEIYWETLFSECILASQEKNPDLYPLLELFIKYGLDVNKYGPSIIGDLYFVSDNNDIYELTKLILNNINRNVDLSLSLFSIGMEESYLNCAFDDMDNESNELFGVIELINAFTNNKPYKSFYKLPKKINEKFTKLSINGDFVVLDQKKVAVKYEKSKMNMITKIDMEKNTLIIKDNYSVYINNEDQNEYEDNIFTKYANQYFKNEKIVDLKFKHYSVEVDPKTLVSGRVVTINFTNNRAITIITVPHKAFIPCFKVFS